MLYVGVLKLEGRTPVSAFAGAQVSLPDEFTGYVLQDDGDGRSPSIVGGFNSLTYWNHCTPPTKGDPLRRCLEWLDLSKKVCNKEVQYICFRYTFLVVR
jgi:hypothetical protein